MIRSMALAFVLALVAACGGVHKFRGETPAGAAASRGASVAYGPVSRACLKSDRKARSRQLCGCIQAVANQTLSPADQRRAVRFYSDPDLAQSTRRSDAARDRRFWRVYETYVAQAEARCA